MKTLALMLIGAAVLGAQADVVTNTMVNTCGGTADLYTDSNWSNGHAPTDATYGTGDYLVNMNVRSVDGTRTFYSHSLTFGTPSAITHVYGKEGHMTFSNDGAFFVNSHFWDWTSGKVAYQLAGPMTFPDAASVACIFGDSPTGQQHCVPRELTGAVKAPAKAKIQILRWTYSDYHTFGIRFSGDLSGFAGTMEIGQCGRLEIGATTMPGTVSVTGTRAFVKPTATTAGFTVGTFASGVDGTTLEMTLNRDTGTCSTITATDRLTVGALTVNVLSETYTLATPAPERKYAIFRFPTAGSTFDADKVTVVSDAVDVSMLEKKVETDDQTGITTFYLVHAASAPIITQTDSSYGSSSATTWSDGLAPHGGAEYYTDKGRLDINDSPFPCHSLTVVGTYVIDRVNDITITNLIVAPAAKKMTLGNWDRANIYDSESLGASGIRYHRGKIRLNAALDVNATMPIHFVLDGNIEGYQSLNFFQVPSSATMDSRLFFELRGTNTFGELSVTPKADSLENGVAICFRTGKALGGNPVLYTDDLNPLNNYVTYLALASTTLATMNRGITANGGAFETAAGVTLTVKQKIKYKGLLHKRGAGTLVLEGDPVPVSGVTPTIDVDAGLLMADTKTATDGLTLNLSGSSAIGARFADEAPAAVGEYGLFNTNGVVNLTGGKLAVKIVSGNPARSGEAPILTVSTAQAAQLRGKIEVAKPAKGYRAEVIEKIVDDGTVTFVAKVHCAGMALIIE